MMDIRLVPAPISLEFSLDENENERFKREYDSLAESDDDAVGQWLKLAKARGETSESDQVMLTLVTELHRKVDQILKRLENRENEFITLEEESEIDGINFDFFALKTDRFVPGKKYYGRISMPTFPKRDVAVYFKAMDNRTAEIVLMHQRDRKEWDSYVTSRERAMIRELKEKNESAD